MHFQSPPFWWLMTTRLKLQLWIKKIWFWVLGYMVSSPLRCAYEISLWIRMHIWKRIWENLPLYRWIRGRALWNWSCKKNELTRHIKSIYHKQKNHHSFTRHIKISKYQSLVNFYLPLLPSNLLKPSKHPNTKHTPPLASKHPKREDLLLLLLRRRGRSWRRWRWADAFAGKRRGDRRVFIRIVTRAEDR